MARISRGQSELTATPVTAKSRSNAKMLHMLRIMQFLSNITMLILFSIRLARLKKVTGRATSAVGAVEGILAAAVVYSLMALVLQKPNRHMAKMMSLGFMVLDVAFVCGFIVVAVLTSPKHYTAAFSCMGSLQINYHMSRFDYCSLPWGPFILGILSTLSYAATAALHGMGQKTATTGFVERKQSREVIDGPVENSTSVATA